MNSSHEYLVKPAPQKSNLAPSPNQNLLKPSSTSYSCTSLSLFTSAPFFHCLPLGLLQSSSIIHLCNPTPPLTFAPIFHSSPLPPTCRIHLYFNSFFIVFQKEENLTMRSDSKVYRCTIER